MGQAIGRNPPLVLSEAAKQPHLQGRERQTGHMQGLHLSSPTSGGVPPGGPPGCLFATQLNCSQEGAFVSQHICNQTFFENMSCLHKHRSTRAPKGRFHPT